jgi:aerobic carbon-monoxide dehydrogenase medium subunit
MRPALFEYDVAADVDQAIGLLEQFGDEAKVLAGGQSLVPMLNFRLVRPRYLIDIGRIKALDSISSVDGGLHIGALTRQRTVEHSDLVREVCPLLAEAIKHVGHQQTRNRGTVGGSLAHSDPAAELPAVVTALDAKLRVKSTAGERVLQAREFFRGSLTTALRPNEILVAVEIPSWPTGTGSGFCEYSRRQGDFAIVGAAAVMHCDANGRVARVRVALIGVGDRPFDATSIATDWLIGHIPDEANCKGAAEEIGASVEPDSDIHAPADYRKHLATVLAGRALLCAAQRAVTPERERGNGH